MNLSICSHRVLRCLTLLLASVCLSHSSEAQSLISNLDFSAPLPGTWTWSGKLKTEPQVVEAKIEGDASLTRALQVEVEAAVDAKPWNSRLTAPQSTQAIAKNDVVMAQFWARSTKDTTVIALMQRTTEPYNRLVRLVADPRAEWRKFTYYGLSRADYAAGTSRFEIQLGQSTGTLEFAGFRVENLGQITVSEAKKRFGPSTPIGPELPAPGTAAATTQIVLPERKSTPYVILKLDDLLNIHGRTPSYWKKAADFTKQRHIKSSIGIICRSLDGDFPEYFQWIKEQQATGLFEFWCHGYEHKQWEENGHGMQDFKGTSYEQQKQYLEKCAALAREKLGFPFASFGSPYNSHDDNTIKALAEVPDFKVWMYGDVKHPAGKVVLERAPATIEVPAFIPNFDQFVRDYSKCPDQEYFLLQGHPNRWNDARFEQFAKIVDFLIQQKAIFTTPEEYARLKGQR